MEVLLERPYPPSIAEALAACHRLVRTARAFRYSANAASALKAAIVSVSRLISILSSIAASTLSMKPVSGLQNGELANTTSSMPLGKKNTLLCSTKRPLSKLQKPPLAHWLQVRVDRELSSTADRWRRRVSSARA
jgi:hypothetical protein